MMVDLEDDPEWSKSDEVEEEDNDRYHANQIWTDYSGNGCECSASRTHILPGNKLKIELLFLPAIP